MPVDELPMYPTPQQAAYVVGSPPTSRKTSLQQPKPTTAYRPAKQQYQQYQAAPPQQHQMQPQYAPTPQQFYQPQSAPQAPVQQYQQHQAPPPQQQYAPAPQQYYVQQLLPQASHFSQQSQPIPQPAHHHHQQQPQQQPIPVQVQLHQQPQQQASQQRYEYSPQEQPQPQYSNQSYSSSPHKKPPPMMSNQSMATVSTHASKLSSKPKTQESKGSSKQKLELELRSVFDRVDVDRSGSISPKELSQALLNFDNTRFQESTITLMIKLFSSSNDVSSAPLKSLNFDQFVSLWKYLSAYKKLFVQADSDKSGDISFGEFQKVLEQIGYKLNIDLVLNLFQKFSYKSLHGGYENGVSVGKLKFDAFIELLVYLRKLTDVFKKYDKDLSGVATISFSDFLFEVSNIS